MRTELLLRVYQAAKKAATKKEIKPVRTHYNTHSFG